MSVLEELGISPEEFAKLDDTQQQKIISGQAKILGNQQLLTQAMLEDDDRDIRNRERAVRKSLLGQDANDCKDQPYDEDEGGEMRITVLGDIYGDKAVDSLHQQKVKVGDDTKITTPPTQQRDNTLRNLLAGGAIALTTAGLTYAGLKYFNPQQPVDLSAWSLKAGSR